MAYIGTMDCNSHHQLSGLHLLQKILNILRSPIVTDFVFAFDQIYQCVDAGRIDQGCPDRSSDIIETVDRRQIADLAADWDDQSLSGNQSGNHCGGTNVGLFHHGPKSSQTVHALSTQSKFETATPP